MCLTSLYSSRGQRGLNDSCCPSKGNVLVQSAMLEGWTERPEIGLGRCLYLPLLSPEASRLEQASGKRELEYRAGEQNADGASDDSKEEQRRAEKEKAGRQKPEGEAAQPDSAEQPGPEEEEGPVNEQAGEAAKQQAFTTPEVSCSENPCLQARHQMTVLTADVSSHEEMHASCTCGAYGNSVATCLGEAMWR